jgi:uncharacterized protein YdiU (UPF0061 family)
MSNLRYRQLPESLYSDQAPQPFTDMTLCDLNESWLEETPHQSAYRCPVYLRDLLNGQLPDQLKPLAMKYDGHQFGHYNPQLGDGRGLLIDEIHGPNQQLFEVHLKGAGMTPYSRGGDGRAVLRSTIREYLGSIAMHGLNIPTTNAIALGASRDWVWREQQEPCATLLRVTPSHIRFGHFEFLYYQRNPEETAQLLDFVMRCHYPELSSTEAWFDKLVNRCARLVAKWQSVGFLHGVMNTDNMSILGETLDYGPYYFLDEYRPRHVANHTDSQGRYRFDRQPSIMRWNLAALAQSLSQVIDAKVLIESVNRFQEYFDEAYRHEMLAKLDLSEEHTGLLERWLELLETHRADYTYSHFLLAQDVTTNFDTLKALFNGDAAFDRWLNDYLKTSSNIDERRTRLRRVNPKFILRHHLLNEVIAKAESGDFSDIAKYRRIFANPFQDHIEEGTMSIPPLKPVPVSLSCSS